VPERAEARSPESEEASVAVAQPASLALSTPGVVLALQRSAGNRAVAGLIARHGPRAVLARDTDTWSKDYKSKKTRQGKTLDEYKALIGTKDAEGYAPAIKAASAWGGTKVSPVALTRAELGAIVLPEGKGDADLASHEKRLDDYLPFINNAFETMGIDTVEAQASFLAHAAESGSFAKMTEVMDATPRAYKPFIGRGPIQVTWEYGYVQALAYVEARGEQLEAEAAALEKTAPGSPEVTRLRDLAALAKEAKVAIKGDINEAANPKYTFLFSTALMHISRGVKRSANLKGASSPAFAGNSNEDQWVTSFQETFQQTLDLAPGRKKAAEDRLAAAEAELAAAAGDASKVKAAQAKIEAEKHTIKLQIGAIRDMPSALRRAKVKKAIYERAHTVLSKKAVAAPPASAAPTAAGPSYYEEDEYTMRHPWRSPAYY
jgi:hypothetical protein